MLKTMPLPLPASIVLPKLSRRALSGRWLLASAVLVLASSAHAQGAAPEGAYEAPAPLPATPLPSPPASAAPASGPLPQLPTPAPQQGEAAASAEPTDPAAYDVATDTDPSALTNFREPLAPYGTWQDDATYGVVWTPHATVVGADFTPYVSHGHWGLTASNSWLWVSDFNWGWAPFHYGRWVWIGGRGWGWIPGRVYAPAWVVWRTGLYDDYYVGWAAMPPTWYWRGGYAYSLGRVPLASYVFCSSSYVFSPRVRSYIAPANRVAMIAPRTRPYLAASGQVAAASSYRTAAFTRGPNPAEAHIPASSVPSARSAPDPRALAFARPAQGAGGLRSSEGLRPLAPGASLPSQRPAPGAPGAFNNGYARPSAPYDARPSAPGSAVSPQPMRPYPGPAPQALPQVPSMRPAYPTEIPRPVPGGPVGGSPSWAGSPGGSMRPMAPPSFGGGGGMRPMAPPSFGGGGSLRPMAPPSFGGGGGMRPMAPGGGGGGAGRPRAR